MRARMSRMRFAGALAVVLVVGTAQIALGGTDTDHQPLIVGETNTATLTTTLNATLTGSGSGFSVTTSGGSGTSAAKFLNNGNGNGSSSTATKASRWASSQVNTAGSYGGGGAGFFDGKQNNGVVAQTASGSANAVQGTNTSTLGGTGVSGTGTTGVSGTSTQVGGDGVLGTAADGVGVSGTGKTGVNGYSSDGYGVSGSSSAGTGVSGSGATGVSGTSSADGGVGVSGTDVNGSGVRGSGTPGVYGESAKGYGMYGTGATGVFGDGEFYGIQGVGADTGVYGTGPTGVYGTGNDYGVTGVGTGTNSRGVRGTGVTGVWGSGSDYGVYGDSTTGTGVYGSGTATGIRGESTVNGGVGVYGGNTNDPNRDGAGVYGYDPTSVGVWGYGSFGVQGQGDLGVYAEGTYGGVQATGPAWAGYFNGDVYITGSCCLASLGAYAMNGSDSPLFRGEAIRVIGVADPPSGSIPVLVVAPARSGDPAVGIVDRAMKRERIPTSDASPRSHPSRSGRAVTTTFLRVAGATAAPGGYLWIATQGLVASVRVDASTGTVRPGDRLTVGRQPGSLAKAVPIRVNGIAFFAPGTTVGYALGTLRNGSGEMAVFVALG